MSHEVVTYGGLAPELSNKSVAVEVTKNAIPCLQNSAITHQFSLMAREARILNDKKGFSRLRPSPKTPSQAHEKNWKGDIERRTFTRRFKDFQLNALN